MSVPLLITEYWSVISSFEQSGKENSNSELKTVKLYRISDSYNNNMNWRTSLNANQIRNIKRLNKKT